MTHAKFSQLPQFEAVDDDRWQIEQSLRLAEGYKTKWNKIDVIDRERCYA